MVKKADGSVDWAKAGPALVAVLALVTGGSGAVGGQVAVSSQVAVIEQRVKALEESKAAEEARLRLIEERTAETVTGVRLLLTAHKLSEGGKP